MTYRGLPAGYDAWKTRSDRDDDWYNEPEPENEDDDMISENELAKELNSALDKDVAMPKTAALKANGGQPQPTVSDDIDRLIARLHSTIRGLEMLKAQL